MAEIIWNTLRTDMPAAFFYSENMGDGESDGADPVCRPRVSG